jgi:hypothetical protein
MHRIASCETRLSNVIIFRNTKFAVEHLIFMLRRREDKDDVLQIGSNQYSSSCVELYVTTYCL